MTEITKRFKLSIEQRRFRRFSEEFKREKVREFMEGRATVTEICKASEIAYTTIYRWIELYSKTNSDNCGS
jgi:transposase-like protein